MREIFSLSGVDAGHHPSYVPERYAIQLETVSWYHWILSVNDGPALHLPASGCHSILSYSHPEVGYRGCSLAFHSLTVSADPGVVQIPLRVAVSHFVVVPVFQVQHPCPGLLTPAVVEVLVSFVASAPVVHD